MDNLFENIVESHKDEPEFDAALNEFFSSIDGRVDPKDYPECFFEKLVKPDNVLTFDVDWVDDSGNKCRNKGYRVQFNNANGPYKGGLRLHPTVNLSILKMLAFEQIFKNALTTLPMGGAKGGSDFDPKGKSPDEVKRFCESFVRKLSPYMGIDKDVPAGDIGVGGREIRYMYEEYKRFTGKDDGALTGKPLDLGGSLCRPEATGFGLCYITQAMLKDLFNTGLAGKSVVISGSGNVAIYAAKKCVELGAKVLTMSDSDSAIFDEKGIDVEFVRILKEERRGRIKDYLDSHPNAKGIGTKDVWSVKADVVLPCATQFEVDANAAKNISENKALCVCEGSNMSTTKEAVEILQSNGVVYIPGKAANAGGVSVSGLEMQQNIAKEHWTFETVDHRLQEIMETIYANIKKNSGISGSKPDFVAGANLAGFLIIADKMIK